MNVSASNSDHFLGQLTQPGSREDFGARFDLQLGESAMLDQRTRYELLR